MLMPGAARPGVYRWPAERVMAVGFSVVLLAILTATLLVWYSLQRTRESSRWVSHTYEVLTAMERAHAALNESVAAGRAFVIAGDARSLAERKATLQELNARVEELKTLTQDNPQQQLRVQQFEALSAERIGIVRETQRLRSEQGFEAVSAYIASGVGRNLVGRIRDVLIEMRDAEQSLLERRNAADATNFQRVIFSVCALLAGVMIAILYSFTRARAELRARRKLADELDRSRRFFESVFEHIPSMVFIKDAQTLRFTAFNRASEEISGVQREAVLGKTAFELYPPKLAERYTAEDRRVLETREMLEIPRERIHPRGRAERILHMRRTFIADELGNPSYVMGIADDITDQVQAQKNIEALNAHLSTLNENLKEQAQMLEAANGELESFCYSVSHDLRAPLRAVNSYSLMLQEDFAEQLPPEAQRFISVISHGATRMGQLIDDLLTFSRLGRSQLNLVAVDMNAAVAHATREVLEGHEGTQPEIIVGPLPEIHADPALLHQVWVNLIGNAVKYSSRVAKPHIEISARTEDARSIYTIRDNGAGFDMRYVHKLFGVFQRLHGEQEFSGTGVGLAIVHRVITRHGGEVTAQSELGKGATFTFSLPRGVAA